jgi:hypothetical protein|tara:strand:+ start:4680 stop:4931 length:252 start_codon:yes stop_codon:yes gene_type:complete
MEQENQNVNSLFNTINYKEPHELNKFIDDMNMDQALFCLVHATRYAHNKGLYDIEESEVISKSIRVLTTPPPLPPEEEEKNEE